MTTCTCVYMRPSPCDTYIYTYRCPSLSPLQARHLTSVHPFRFPFFSFSKQSFVSFVRKMTKKKSWHLDPWRDRRCTHAHTPIHTTCALFRPENRLDSTRPFFSSLPQFPIRSSSIPKYPIVVRKLFYRGLCDNWRRQPEFDSKKTQGTRYPFVRITNKRIYLSYCYSI